MQRFTKKVILVLGLTILVLLFLFFNPAYQAKVDFSAEIKPILNKHCIHCHGGVKTNGDLSMMTREDLLKGGESGKAAIVPGKPKASELYKRLLSEDLDERMPYEHPPLAKSKIRLIKKWINEGAVWGKHWAFEPVKKIDLPKSKFLKGSLNKEAQKWVQNPIDYFILDKQKEQGLTPGSKADPPTLLRRLSLDLIGMSSSSEISELFLETSTEDNYNKLVDDLLERPQFGEKWASMWLDLARYADSKGPVRDLKRDIWEYRDWVIRAFNKDLPYNQFIIEQVAGDMLPNPADAQYIATGFHRNTTTNDEGGTDNEEFRAAAVVDRVNTTWEAFMGSTFACTQCHGHPYDPIKHEEYFEFMAYLDNTRDNDTFDDYPWLRSLSEEEQAELEQLKSWMLDNDFDKEAKATEVFIKTWQPVYYSLLADSFINAEIYDTKFLGLRHNAIARLKKVELTGKDNLIFRYRSWRDGGVWKLHLDRPDGPVIATVSVKKTGGWALTEIALPEGLNGLHHLYFTYQNQALANSIAEGVRFDWFHFGSKFPGADLPDYDLNKKRYWNLLSAQAPHTLIMMENPPYMQRTTHLWSRGSWASQEEKVEVDLPDIFKGNLEKIPADRLELAQWIASRENPLTARTIVNRLWEQLMGRGLVETLEDLGTQGEAPTHPALLDYLAWQLMYEYDWSLKRLIKEIVTSATYQQSSVVAENTMDKDPLNLWYTRANRLRLSAEQVRDEALKVSGLLNKEMYGPPVMPYQPEGIWSNPYNAKTWTNSEGKSRHRRAVYTFWKRTAPYPAFITFDAAPRNVCAAKRIRTNTPLQALVTLNDPAFMEMALNLALSEGAKLAQKDAKEWLINIYQLAIGKNITESRKETLIKFYEEMLLDYQKDVTAREELLQSVEKEKQTAELAAMVLVANAILNLDEFITRS